MNPSKIILSAALAVSASIVAAPASAQVVETFATFSAIDGSNVAWDNDGSGGTFVSTGSAITVTPGARAVSFSFLRPGLTSLNNISAVFSMAASAPSGNPAATDGSFLTQRGIGGNFSFISTQAYVVGDTVFAAGSNLLSGSFGNATIFGALDGPTAVFSGFDNAPQTVAYTSDFFDFNALTSDEFSIGLGAVSDPLFATPGSALRDFNAIASGSFSGAFAAVPEPATWGMMILGFGFIGGALRHRRRTATFNFA